MSVCSITPLVHPDLGTAAIWTMVAVAAVVLTLATIATLVALFAGPERAQRAHRVLRDLLAVLRQALALLGRWGGGR